MKFTMKADKESIIRLKPSPMYLNKNVEYVREYVETQRFKRMAAKRELDKKKELEELNGI